MSSLELLCSMFRLPEEGGRRNPYTTMASPKQEPVPHACRIRSLCCETLITTRSAYAIIHFFPQEFTPRGFRSALPAVFSPNSRRGPQLPLQPGSERLPMSSLFVQAQPPFLSLPASLSLLICFSCFRLAVRPALPESNPRIGNTSLPETGLESPLGTRSFLRRTADGPERLLFFREICCCARVSARLCLVVCRVFFRFFRFVYPVVFLQLPVSPAFSFESRHSEP